MALMKPIPKSVSAFDSIDSQMFYFNVPSGGSQVQANRMIIKDNISNAICYDEKITSQAYEHQYSPSNAIIPLENGKSYNVCFITYDIDDNASSNVEDAISILFYCYTTPILEITNLGSVVDSVSKTFEISYSQEEGEKLKSFTVRLYDYNNIEISKKETIEANVTTWFYSGFENEKNYRIEIDGITEYNTIIPTRSYSFFVRYSVPSLYSDLELNNDADNGYTEVISNLIIIDGETNKPPIYIDGEKIDLTRMGSVLEWNKGYEIPEEFELEIWFTLSELGEICRLKKKTEMVDVYDDNGNDEVFYSKNRKLEKVFGVYSVNDKYLTLSIERGKVNDEYKDYLLLQDGQNVLRISSNKVDMLASGSKIVAYIKRTVNRNQNGKVVSDDYSVILDVYEAVESIAEWNEDTSTLVYNGASTLVYKDEEPTTTDNYVEDYNYLLDDNFFPLTSTRIRNGIFEHINISKVSSSSTYPHYEDMEWFYRPQWNYYTILDCDFKNNINGGNLNVTLDQIQYIYIKRREFGKNEWVTIYKKEINVVDDLQINYQDRYTPSMKTFTYAIVPISPNGSEGEYTINTTTTCFRNVYVMDNEKTFKLYSGIAYADTTRNKLIGMVQPIGKRYPIIIENSDVDYLSGGVSGKLYGYNFEKYRYVDRFDVTEQTQDFSDFISNGKCKLIKDWNGNIWMARLSQPPTINYEQAYGNGISQVSFSWIEQGKWDNQEDLDENGFV